LPPDELVLFLDENLHNCRPILKALDEAKVPYQRHGATFASGTPDEHWLPTVGRNGWLLITADQRIRYNQLERQAVMAHGVREFVFTSGNLSGTVMAGLLIKALPQMVKLCQRTAPPFIASITKSGAVHLRYDKGGSVHAARHRR
jgi:PIN like domain